MYVHGSSFELWSHTGLLEWTCSVLYCALRCRRQEWREWRISERSLFGSKTAIFCPVWPWNLTDDLEKNNKAPFLCYFKLRASFHGHQSIQTGVTIRKCSIRVKINLFLAANKQLYEWFSLSVCLSVRHTFLTMFPSSYHHEIVRSYYQWQKWRPCKRSRSEVKGQGHRGQNPT